MSGRLLMATDLDRTLIYSAAAAAVPDGALPAGAVGVEIFEGRAISFMSAPAAAMFAELAQEHLVLPVTSRTPAQFARVRLPGPPLRYAVVANGGIILVDGRPDEAWSESVRSAVSRVAPLEAAVQAMTGVCVPDWSAAPRVAAALFCYAVVDRMTMPPDTVARLRVWADEAGWRVSLQGRKLYALPVPLTKSRAVAEIARRTRTGVTLAAGDSLLDIDLLAAADRAVRPGHGELAESGWSAASVDVLSSTGIHAGEEILAWFQARAVDAGLGVRR